MKTPDRKWDWGVNDAMLESEKWEFGDFEKGISWDPTLGHASPAGGYGMHSVCVQSDSTVSIVKIMSLSPRVEKLKWRS